MCPWICPSLPLVWDFVFSEVWLHLTQDCVCVCVFVIAMSLCCLAAALASGLFIVTASLAVTTNGEAQFVLVCSEGLFGLRLCEDLMRSSRRARPGVCIGRNNLQVKVASTETCGLFLNTDREPRAFSAHNWSTQHAQSTRAHVHVCTHSHTHTSFQYKHKHCKNTSGVRE